MRILAKEDNHQALTCSYDELINERPANTITTRATARGEPPTIYAKSSAYHGSFLPKTVRELKAKLQYTELTD